MRLTWAVVGILLVAPRAGAAEPRHFLTAGLGISNVSADGSTTPPQAADLRVAGYKPQNGIAAAAAGGAHLTRFVSVQGSYFYNRNRLQFFQFEQQGGALASSEVRTHAQSHTGFGELLLYVRPRDNWLRPYLSAGAGVMRLTAPVGLFSNRKMSLQEAGEGSCGQEGL